MPISIALNNAATSKTELHEYVKITPFSPNSAWTSWTIKAVIAQTAIDKENTFNLMKPLVTKKQKAWVTPKITTAETKTKKKLMLQELVEVCKQCLGEGKMIPEEVKSLNVAGMIKNQIGLLEFKQMVQDMEDKMIAKFIDVFKPLPHMDKLP